MIVEGIEIRNFRNIARADLSFSPSYNLVTGPNAQGKTNLIEAIHLFSLARSFRTRQLDETIRFGEEFASLRLRARSDAGVELPMEVSFERGGGARAAVGGKRLAGLSELIGVIPSVVFVAEDTLLSSGPPQARRSYIDYTAAQISPAFLRDLKEYRRVLRQRNALLERAAREGRDPDGMEAWDGMLADRGEAIVRERIETLREIERRARPLFDEILGGSAGFGMTYRCSFGGVGREPGRPPGEALREALERVRGAERRRGYTMAGPHYDDASIALEGTELRRYGSQGRRRLAAIVLKLAQAITIMERRGERPIVLLDDIFSELDGATAARLGAHVAGRYQSFVATPRPGDAGGAPAGAALFRVEAGAFQTA